METLAPHRTDRHDHLRLAARGAESLTAARQHVHNKELTAEPADISTKGSPLASACEPSSRLVIPVFGVQTGTSAIPCVDGKFIQVGGRRFLVKGVAYGTFAPDATGAQFPDDARVKADFQAIAAAGFNTVRTYTVPSRAVLDAAARAGLRMMIGVPWPQHVAFLDDRAAGAPDPARGTRRCSRPCVAPGRVDVRRRQ